MLTDFDQLHLEIYSSKGMIYGVTCWIIKQRTEVSYEKNPTKCVFLKIKKTTYKA